MDVANEYDSHVEAAAHYDVSVAYVICSNISNVFLFITFCIYLALPELRRPLFGQITMIFIFSLFWAYVMFSVTAYGRHRLMSDDNSDHSYDLQCQILGFLALFLYFHAFCWMNVLSFDIYRKFTRIRSLERKQEKKQEQVRLVRYVVYALGASSLLTITAIVFQLLPDSYQGLRPGFGEESCFFSTPLANFVFFHLYVLLIQVSNIVFFLLTIIHLQRTWSATKRMSAHSGGTKRRRARRARENFKIIGKLFIVMGITWLSEFVSFVLSWILGKEAVWKYLIVNDLINLSQGILIFVVLVCKPSVIRRLKARCSSCNENESNTDRANIRSFHRNTSRWDSSVTTNEDGGGPEQVDISRLSRLQKRFARRLPSLEEVSDSKRVQCDENQEQVDKEDNDDWERGKEIVLLTGIAVISGNFSPAADLKPLEAQEGPGQSGKPEQTDKVDTVKEEAIKDAKKNDKKSCFARNEVEMQDEEEDEKSRN